jgi:hypothetical protein
MSLDLSGMPADASEVPESQLKELSDMGPMHGMHHTAGMGSMHHTGESGEKLRPASHHVAHSHDSSEEESSSLKEQLSKLLANELIEDYAKHSHSVESEESGEDASQELLKLKPNSDEYEQFLNKLERNFESRRKLGPRSF